MIKSILRALYLIPYALFSLFTKTVLAKPHPITQTEVKQKIDLPECILKDLDKIIVNRQGQHQQSYMVTQDIIGFVEPKQVYQLTQEGLIPVYPDRYISNPHVESQMPAQAIVSAKWNEHANIFNPKSNILSKQMGAFEIDQEVLCIPEALATKENLAYYEARLFKINDLIEFETMSPLPVTIMNIGTRYVDSFLLQEQLGGGAYVEYHDRPHLHMPLHFESQGHLILAKKIGDHYSMSAFQIPYGYAVYTPPNVIHDDCFLIGKYLVVYSITDQFSTVLIQRTPNKMVKVHIQTLNRLRQGQQLHHAIQ